MIRIAIVDDHALFGPGRVMEKMKLASNSELTYYALKNGLIQ